MKEATGELNMTVVTVVAIAAVGAFFYMFVWPAIQNSIAKNTCANICPNGEVQSASVSQNTCTCADGTEMVLDEERE